MPEENWTFGVGSVSADPLCPLSASSTSSPLIAGRTDTVTVLILSLPLLGRKMCLNLWRYLFPIVSVRLWKLSSRIMSPSLICLPVSSAILSEVGLWCETQQLQKKKKKSIPRSHHHCLCQRPGVMWWSPHSPYLCSYHSSSSHSVSHLLLLRSHVHIPSSGLCDVYSPLSSLLPSRIF